MSGPVEFLPEQPPGDPDPPPGRRGRTRPRTRRADPRGVRARRPARLDALLSRLRDGPPGRLLDRVRAHRHGRLALRSAAAAIAVAGVLAWGVTRPAADPGARPTPVPTAPSSSPAYGSTLIVCTRGVVPNPDLSHAMLRYLPGIELDLGDTQRCVRGTGENRHVVAEELEGRYRGAVVQLDVRARTAPGLAPGAAARNAAGPGSVEIEGPGLVATVLVFGERPVPPLQLQRLATYITLNLAL